MRQTPIVWSTVIIAAVAAAMLVPATASAGATPVRVTRFHLNQPIAPQPVAIEPATGTDPESLEQQVFARAVADQLQQIGFARQIGDSTAPLIATVSFKRTTREETADRSPVSIGIGGGSFGGGFGGGASVGFGVGKKPTRTFYTTELFVQLRRRDDGSAVWEGRAQLEANARSKDGQPGAAADKLALALFRGFPGESGRTITVK